MLLLKNNVYFCTKVLVLCVWYTDIEANECSSNNLCSGSKHCCRQIRFVAKIALINLVGLPVIVLRESTVVMESVVPIAPHALIIDNVYRESFVVIVVNFV